MTVRDKLNAVSLVEAKEWQATPEKFIYCIDYLEISAHQCNADHLVDKLELIFQGLLDPSQEIRKC
jgi:hypothetical protein